MVDRTTNHSCVEDKPGRSDYYCFGCLGHGKEKHVQKYAFQCGSLKEILQMDSIFLCYLCKRMAQHTEMFIQNVQSNQILLENFHNVMDETLKSLSIQNQPLVNLTRVPFYVIELSERDGNSLEESYSVICSRSQSTEVQVKFEMKEEVDMDHLEGEFINDDEFSDTYVKEEDSFPLKALLKEELETVDHDSIDLMSLTRTLKKKKVIKKGKIKKEGSRQLKNNVTNIKMIYITREQCMEERSRMRHDQKYADCAYKCEDCIKGFSFKGSYDKHMEKHNQSMGDFECDICKQRMDSEEKLVSHMRYHLIRYKCGDCGLIRNCRVTIQDHYIAYHCQGLYHTCPHCSKTFKRPMSLRKHVNYAHTHKERVQCAYCHKTYATKDVLRSHMIIQHSKEVAAGEVHKKYVCQECGMAFKAPSQLRNHSIKHSDSRDYYCVECDKSFKSDAVLKNHLKTAATHVNYIELPLHCLHCDKRFAIRRDLERHTNRVHLNVKPFKCDRCEKAYISSWALKEHKRLIHEGYKRPLQFPCPMCDKVFDRNQILKSHIRTHTGERPYQCSKCPAQFSQANILRTHDRLIHLKLTRDGRPKPNSVKIL